MGCVYVCVHVREMGWKPPSVQDVGRMNPELIQTYDLLQLPPSPANPGVQKSHRKRYLCNCRVCTIWTF